MLLAQKKNGLGPGGAEALAGVLGKMTEMQALRLVRGAGTDQDEREMEGEIDDLELELHGRRRHSPPPSLFYLSARAKVGRHGGWGVILLRRMATEGGGKGGRRKKRWPSARACVFVMEMV